MIALLLSFGMVFGQTPGSQVTRFAWSASGTLNIAVVKNGQTIAFPTASLRDAAGETVEMDGGGLHAVVTTYGPFASVIFGKAGGDAELILLERKNATTEAISDAIPGRLAEMPGRLQAIIKLFAERQKQDGKDVSGVFRNMAAYFDLYPGKQINDYADELERGTDVVTLVQKPPTRVADQPVVTTGPAPAPRATPPAPRRVAQPQPRQPPPYWQQQQPAARERIVRRQPMPPEYGYPQQQPQQQSRSGGFFGGMFD